MGYVHIYTGNGKGKTTSSFGLALRALGHGMRVYIAQFLKDGESGEVKAIEKLGVDIEVESFGKEFGGKWDFSEEDKEVAKKLLEKASKAATNGNYNIVILDEVNVALDKGLIPLNDILDLIKNKKTELILTGRNAPKELTEKADLVTEMKEIEHYFKKGVVARKGIEF